MQLEYDEYDLSYHQSKPHRPSLSLSFLNTCILTLPHYSHFSAIYSLLFSAPMYIY